MTKDEAIAHIASHSTKRWLTSADMSTYYKDILPMRPSRFIRTFEHFGIPTTDILSQAKKDGLQHRMGYIVLPGTKLRWKIGDDYLYES